MKPVGSTTGSATGGLGALRKPGSSILSKKKGVTVGKISKLSMKLPVKGVTVEEDDHFEDIEETQKNAAAAEARAKQIAQDEALTKKMQEELM